ncbi:TraR/DksA family transcriptional regulator [Streptomyces sp. NPDC059578]|uniref:TraR/DksA family transcriptional regulator n=1 Tax=unclassified Streptomyces TaxID=2593676 RepID=UPI0036681DB4
MVAKKTAAQYAPSGADAPSGGAGGDGPGAAGKAPAKKAPAKATTKKATKKAAAKGTAAKEAAPKKAPAKRTAAKKTAAKKTAAQKGVAQKAVHEEVVAGEPAVGEGPAKESTAAKRTAARKATAGKGGRTTTTTTTSTSAGRSSKRAAGRADIPGAAETTPGGATKRSGSRRGTRSTDRATAVAETTGATTVVAKKTRGTTTGTKAPTSVPGARLAAAEPGELPVRPGEDAWTAEEVAEARALLSADATRLREEISSSEASLAGLMRDSGDGAGDDQADTGTKNITREHELSLTANARTMLEQTEHALERLAAGTYGLCENCGKPIGKARMQAFPRATLCVECKQKQERRG